MYTRMRTIAIYACMVVSFLQLASCSSHHRMYDVASRENAQCERERKRDKVLRRVDREKVNRLRRWNKISCVLNVALLAPVLYSCWCWWWWPQASDSLANTSNAVMHNLTRMVDELNGQLTSIEDNFNLEWLHLFKKAEDDFNLEWVQFLKKTMDMNDIVQNFRERFNTIATYLGDWREIKENQYCRSTHTSIFAP